MEEVIKIIKELQANSGKKLQEILEENKDNQMLKDVLAEVCTLVRGLLDEGV